MSALLDSVTEKVDDLAYAVSDVTYVVSGELAEQVNTVIQKVQAEELKRIRKKEAAEKEEAARQAQERDPFLGKNAEIHTQAVSGLVKSTEHHTTGHDTASLLSTETFSTESDLSQTPDMVRENKSRGQNDADSLSGDGKSVLQINQNGKERTGSTRLKTFKKGPERGGERKNSSSRRERKAEGEKMRLMAPSLSTLTQPQWMFLALSQSSSLLLNVHGLSETKHISLYAVEIILVDQKPVFKPHVFFLSLPCYVRFGDSSSA